MTKKIRLVFVLVMMFLGAAGVLGVSVPVHATSSAVVTNIAQQRASVGEIVVDQVTHSWPWYVSRGSGILAAILLVLLMLSGIGMLTGHTYKVLEPLSAWTSHRALGIAFGVSVLIHVFVLLFDKFTTFSLTALLVPFISKLEPVTLFGVNIGSLYVALGIFALYAIVAIILTSLIWIDKKPHTWRLVHYLSYFAMLAVFFHALFLGTDLKGGVFRILWILAGLVVLGGAGLRLWRARTTEIKK